MTWLTKTFPESYHHSCLSNWWKIIYDRKKQQEEVLVVCFLKPISVMYFIWNSFEPVHNICFTFWQAITVYFAFKLNSSFALCKFRSIQIIYNSVFIAFSTSANAIEINIIWYTSYAILFDVLNKQLKHLLSKHTTLGKCISFQCLATVVWSCFWPTKM